MPKTIAAAIALALLAADARAQVADDLTTIDGIMRAYYDVISGPAGSAPDRQRDQRLHRPGAIVGLSRPTADGGTAIDVTSLAGFYEKHGGVRKEPFYEWELHRVTRQFGNAAHAWSSYAVGKTHRGTPDRHGVTSVQLYFDGARWWITGWLSEPETPRRPIPTDLMMAGAQAANADEAAIRDVVRRYAAAREARDRNAIEALFTPDADQLVSSGEWRRGRDALVTGAMASSAQTGGTRAIDVDALRLVGADVAIADARYEISGLAGGATRRMWSTFILVRHEGEWRISAIRNMLPAAPVPTAAPSGRPGR